MAGLIVALLLALAALQEPPAPPGHLERVQDLLVAERPHDAWWRNTLFQSITRLEHAPVQIVLPAWEALAADGGHSNLILYLRRHGLPLPAEEVAEDADTALERALAAWGSGDLLDAQRRLEDGVAAWPADPRFANNLPWLHGRFPASLEAAAGSRELAQAVLAARGALD